MRPHGLGQVLGLRYGRPAVRGVFQNASVEKVGRRVEQRLHIGQETGVRSLASARNAVAAEQQRDLVAHVLERPRLADVGLEIRLLPPAIDLHQVVQPRQRIFSPLHRGRGQPVGGHLIRVRICCRQRAGPLRFFERQIRGGLLPPQLRHQLRAHCGIIHRQRGARTSLDQLEDVLVELFEGLVPQRHLRRRIGWRLRRAEFGTQPFHPASAVIRLVAVELLHRQSAGIPCLGGIGDAAARRTLVKVAEPRGVLDVGELVGGAGGLVGGVEQLVQARQRAGVQYLVGARFRGLVAVVAQQLADVAGRVGHPVGLLRVGFEAMVGTPAVDGRQLVQDRRRVLAGLHRDAGDVVDLDR